MSVLNMDNKKSNSLVLTRPAATRSILRMLCLCGEKEELQGRHQHAPSGYNCVLVAEGTTLFS